MSSRFIFRHRGEAEMVGGMLPCPGSGTKHRDGLRLHGNDKEERANPLLVYREALGHRRLVEQAPVSRRSQGTTSPGLTLSACSAAISRLQSVTRKAHQGACWTQEAAVARLSLPPDCTVTGHASGEARMLKFYTAGESHGQALFAYISGLPAQLPIDLKFINTELHRRQLGYGRGGRQKIEQDRAEVFAGVRHGKTIGAPVALRIENRDWANWEKILPVEPAEDDPGARKLVAARPCRPGRVFKIQLSRRALCSRARLRPRNRRARRRRRVCQNPLEGIRQGNRQPYPSGRQHPSEFLQEDF